jgi:Zn-dependent peptidase ImmA (M78 family)
MRQHGIRAARRAARALLHRFGVRAAEHIQLDSFAKHLGVSILIDRLDGAQAELVRAGSHAHIILSNRITDECAMRFCFNTAHELGHLVLDHPPSPLAALCGEQQPTRRAREDVRDFEAEANAFAGELLMPDDLLRRRCETSPVSLAVPFEIAAEFRVSILASSIRFAELTSERCAAVFSAKRTVKWCAPSATFTREIERGTRLDPASIAWDYYQTGDLDDRPQQVAADAWFRTSADVEIVEHSIASKELGTVLSMLWVPERVAAPLGLE